MPQVLGGGLQIHGIEGKDGLERPFKLATERQSLRSGEWKRFTG